MFLYDQVGEGMTRVEGSWYVLRRFPNKDGKTGKLGEEALTQRCYCGRVLIGRWLAVTGQEGQAGASTYYFPSRAHPAAQEIHSRDECLAPRRLPKAKVGR